MSPFLGDPNYAQFRSLVPHSADPFYMNTVVEGLADGRKRHELKLAVHGRRDEIEAGTLTADALAVELGCSRASVYKYCKQLGFKMPNVTPRYLPKIAELIADLKMGKKPKEIAEAAGVSVQAVYGALVMGGFRLRGGRVIVDPNDTRGTIAQRCMHVDDVLRRVDEIIAERRAA